VDDEPFVLEGISRQLRRDYDVTVAAGGVPALEQLAHNGPFAVIVSDLRMPGMDGVELLNYVRQIAPDTVRLLLTGFADIEAAIAVVNEAQVFRFLTKPCHRDQLVKALEAGVQQHRLVTAERVLLEETLHGSVRALMDALALANPMAFGRASRVKDQVSAVAAALELPDRWQVEVAAMLSLIGMISLPAPLVEKLFLGQALSADEQELVDRLPALTDQLLAHVPRLEEVRRIVRHQATPFNRGAGEVCGAEAVPAGAHVLKVVLDFDALESRCLAPAEALDQMYGRLGWYDPRVLEAFGRLHGHGQAAQEVKVMPVDAVLPGMRFMEDVKTSSGVLLIPKGFEMNAALRERLQGFDKAVLRQQVSVLLKAA
jgi:response regulator RpfG family c-di-GMP phosphodiesterase